MDAISEINSAVVISLAGNKEQVIYITEPVHKQMTGMYQSFKVHAYNAKTNQIKLMDIGTAHLVMIREVEPEEIKALRTKLRNKALRHVGNKHD